MLVPLSWLKEYVEIPLATAALAERLTLAGLEVANVQTIGDWWEPKTLVVGQVIKVAPHPNADRLVLVDIEHGEAEPQRVVTGAPNLFAYREAAELPTLKVAFARNGALLVDAYSEQRPRPKKELKPSKIRGVLSAGMVCSERELGLSEEHEGIILLPADAPVGMPLADYLGDQVLEIEITPDMARCLNVIGVAHEVAALTGGALHLPADSHQPQGHDQASDYVAVRIDDPALCNRYVALLISGVQIGPSPRWLQTRLSKAGLRPINNVVDITNYVMLEWGQPLHAFDYDVLKARAARVGDAKPTIIVRRAAAGEKFTTLDKVERTLDDSMLMIADTAGSLAIAGVMGGQESEVTEQTTTILLEAATFAGINNRRTAQALKLFSEASYRFARGIPAQLNPIATRRAAELMRLWAGGRIVPGLVDAYPVPQAERLVYTTQSDVRRLLGMPVTFEEIAEALRRLDFQVEVAYEVAESAPVEATFGLAQQALEPLLECVAPWHRLDVAIPADLTEEVARMIGYERVGTTLLAETLPTQRRNELFETEEQVRNILVNLGLQENINNPLTTPENHAKLRMAGAALDDPYVTLANPIAPERRAMRRTLLVSALESTARDLRFTNRLTTFEVGRIYLPEQGDLSWVGILPPPNLPQRGGGTVTSSTRSRLPPQTGEGWGGVSENLPLKEQGDALLPQEDRRISIVLTGPRQPANFYTHATPSQGLDFYDLKGMVETLLERLGFAATQVTYQAQPDTGTFGPRCAQVLLNGQPLGLIGELHPRVRAAFGLPAVRVNVAELRIAPLIKPAWSFQPMPPISSYPPVVEDLAFEVAEEITAQRIQHILRSVGGEVLTTLELFDIYRGEPIPLGHKSMAYRLTYQSPTRSLSEKEVTHLRQRMIAAVEKETGGRLRG